MKEDDDALALALGLVRDHVRRERADDAALEAIARGDTGPESAALEERAASDVEAAAMVAASRPLGAAAEEAIVARIPRANADARASAYANANPKERARAAWFGGRMMPIAGGLALAAAIVVYVAAGRHQDGPHAMLPDYALRATSEQTMRGAPESAEAARAVLHVHAHADAPFEITARPATAAGTKVVAYLFAIGEGEPSAVDAKLEVAGEGAVRITGRSRALEGARELRLVIGSATSDSIVRYDDALSRARAGNSDAHVRVLAVTIVRD